MLRGLYTATAGMRVQQYRQDNIADNLANINTPGFKKSLLTLQSFPELLMKHIPSGKRIGKLPTGVLAAGVEQLFTPGSLSETGRTTDIAIKGEGFLQVVNQEGEVYYTRNGALTVDAEGYLATAGGLRVCDVSEQPIKVEGELQIDRRGRVAETGQQIKLVSFADYGQLNRAGNGLWTTTPENTVLVNEPHVLQGYLEASNVDLSQEMVDMIAALRAYQLNSRVFRTIDGTLERAINEITKV